MFAQSLQSDEYAISCVPSCHGQGMAKAAAGVCPGIALGTTVLNWLYVEPINTKLMFERYALENDKGERDEAKISQMKKDFGKWHASSSILNLAGLCGMLAHGWWLGSRLMLISA